MILGDKMKSILFASLAVVALASGTAFAADLPAPVYKAPPPPPPTWTGCYVSAGVGYGLLDDERSGSSFGTPLPNSTSAAKGWLGSFGGGCDYQFTNNPLPFGPIVIGAFGDYDPGSITGSYGDPVNASQSGTQTLQNAWYAGARAGFLITPNVLTYFDGGATGAHIAPITLSTFDSLPAANPTGWFLGGGYEYALNWLPIQGLFWKTEYRFAEYEAYNQNYIHPTFVGTATTIHNNADVQTITSSLVWRFNWQGR
jgi:outer membrane immunogenic protein